MPRPLCNKCGYIKARCLCEYLSTIENKTPLIILQHPSEKKHALNTVAIMKNFFNNITVLEGEDFNGNPFLQDLIANQSPALIFPTTPSQTLKAQDTGKISHYIFIDGTWNKAKKIYFTSTLLHLIPAFSLNVTEKSRYKIRMSQFEKGLSTLEACTNVLALSEPDCETKDLLNCFEKMIEFQIEKMGEEVFKKYYGR